MHPKLIEKQNELAMRFSSTNIAERVNATELFAINHGFEEWDGIDISTFIASLLEEYTLWLVENKPYVMESLTQQEAEERTRKMAEASVRLNNFLDIEDKKIKEAELLLKEMDSYWLGPVDLRYRRAREKYRKIVNSFELVGKNYDLKLPDLTK